VSCWPGTGSYVVTETEDLGDDLDIKFLIRKKHLRCTVLAMAQDLEQLIEEITVDAYDLYEQLSGFLQVWRRPAGVA
jgi:hypothetical protein